MASYGNTVLTSAGIDLVKRVVANTATFEITRVATSSDSRLTNATISTIEALTTMSSVQQTGKVTAFDTSNSKQVGLKCEFTNQGLTNQYNICGVGIYAKEAGKSEILFAVAPAKEPETMPAKPNDQSALFAFSLNMYVVVGQASAMSITATTEGVVKSINSTIKPDANGNVTMSYYSQAEVDQKISSLSSMIDSKVNAAKAEASAKADQVQNNVNALSSRVSDIQVGGKNLLRNTRALDSNVWVNRDAWPTAGYYKECQIRQSNTTLWNGLTQYIEVREGEDYVFSVDVRSGDGASHANVAGFYVSLYGDKEGSYTKASSPSDNQAFTYTPTWQRLSFQVKITSNGYIKPRIERMENAGGMLQFARPKFEKGNIPTDWTPAPEDLEDVADAALNGLTETSKFALSVSAKAEANANSIQALDASKVGKTDFNASSGQKMYISYVLVPGYAITSSVFLSVPLSKQISSTTKMSAGINSIHLFISGKGDYYLQNTDIYRTVVTPNHHANMATLQLYLNDAATKRINCSDSQPFTAWVDITLTIK